MSTHHIGKQSVSIFILSTGKTKSEKGENKRYIFERGLGGLGSPLRVSV